MASRNTLIWVGAAALAIVAAGAGAVVWTHPDFLEQNPADLLVGVTAPIEFEAPDCPSGHSGCPCSAAGKRPGSCR